MYVEKCVKSAEKNGDALETIAVKTLIFIFMIHTHINERKGKELSREQMQKEEKGKRKRGKRTGPINGAQ